mgnify:FL=1|jgi:hypothetical protein
MSLLEIKDLINVVLPFPSSPMIAALSLLFKIKLKFLSKYLSEFLNFIFKFLTSP